MGKATVLAAIALLLVVPNAAAGPAAPRLYRTPVTALADGTRFLVWESRGGLSVLGDGQTWKHARTYRLPVGCTAHVIYPEPHTFVGPGHAVVRCVGSNPGCGSAGDPPRIVDLRTGIVSAIPRLRIDGGCFYDFETQVGENVIEFGSSTYHSEGAPYSVNWRTGAPLAGDEWDKYRRHIFDVNSPTGLTEVCAPLRPRSTLTGGSYPDEDGLPINDPAWLERPYLITASADGLFLDRCGSGIHRRLAVDYGGPGPSNGAAVARGPVVTRTYVGWVSRNHLVVRMLRSRRTYRWPLPAKSHGVSLSGTRGTVLVISYKRRYGFCPCDTRAVDLQPRRR